MVLPFPTDVGTGKGCSVPSGSERVFSSVGFGKGVQLRRLEVAAFESDDRFGSAGSRLLLAAEDEPQDRAYEDQHAGEHDEGDPSILAGVDPARAGPQRQQQQAPKYRSQRVDGPHATTATVFTHVSGCSGPLCEPTQPVTLNPWASTMEGIAARAPRALTGPSPAPRRGPALASPIDSDRRCVRPAARTCRRRSCARARGGCPGRTSSPPRCPRRFRRPG